MPDLTTLQALATEGIDLETDLSAGKDVEQRLGTWHDALFDAGVPVDELSDERNFEDLQAAREALKTAIDQARTTPVAPPEATES